MKEDIIEIINNSDENTIDLLLAFVENLSGTTPQSLRDSSPYTGEPMRNAEDSVPYRVESGRDNNTADNDIMVSA